MIHLPVAKLFTTPIQSADAIAESTALPPFCNTMIIIVNKVLIYYTMNPLTV